jgi:hypothetical protein
MANGGFLRKMEGDGVAIRFVHDGYDIIMSFAFRAFPFPAELQQAFLLHIPVFCGYMSKSDARRIVLPPALPDLDRFLADIPDPPPDESE